MIDQAVTVLGIPLPSSSPVFLTIVAIHIAAGIICVVAGVFAMLAPKQPGRHPAAGTIYYWSLVVVFLTMSILAILRWPADNILAGLGLGSFVAGTVGRRARQRMRPAWPTLHVTGMAVSFILLLTAFYVDNGANLPLWRALPHATYWILPSAIGLPLLAWALLRHPVVVHERENDESRR